MTKENVIKSLRNLEEIYHKKEGYNTIQILTQLKIEPNRENAKMLRKCLRSMISNNVYPEFLTAGEYDIVYCPQGKGSGCYRLSEYREI